MTLLKNPDDRATFLKRLRAGRLRLAAAGLFAAVLAGCSVTIPLPSFMDSDVTGSIKPKASPLSPDIDAADWRIAEPALAKALKSTPPDEPVAWSNPDTGDGGAFQPVAGLFKRDGQTCRAFVARIDIPDRTSMVQAIGCPMARETVFVDEAQPWKGF